MDGLRRSPVAQRARRVRVYRGGRKGGGGARRRVPLGPSRRHAPPPARADGSPPAPAAATGRRRHRGALPTPAAPRALPIRAAPRRPQTVWIARPPAERRPARASTGRVVVPLHARLGVDAASVDALAGGGPLAAPPPPPSVFSPLPRGGRAVAHHGPRWGVPAACDGGGGGRRRRVDGGGRDQGQGVQTKRNGTRGGEGGEGFGRAAQRRAWARTAAPCVDPCGRAATDEPGVWVLSRCAFRVGGTVCSGMVRRRTPTWASTWTTARAAFSMRSLQT